MDSPVAVADALLARERRVLSALGDFLGAVDAPEPTRRRLADLAGSLDELFLLVVVGEFNAGKSTVVNALFGKRLMEEGPVPTTDRITVLRYGEADEAHRRGEFVTERRVDEPLLRHIALVDTPGTNSIIEEHQALTEDFVPRADLVLFVTSYDRPLSESERQLLRYIRGAWGKRLVVAINKADLAETEAALAQVLAHVRDGLATLMDGAALPLLFPVAARLALQAKLDHGDDYRSDPRWEASRFGPFQRFVTETLGEKTRLAIKLSAPLDAARALLDDASSRLSERRSVLSGDEEAIAQLDARFAGARSDLDEITQRAVSDVDRELLEMERRGTRFLDDTIRITRLNLLRDRNAFREEFDRQVVRDSERRIETRLGEAADALLRRAYDLWNETYTRLADLRRTGAPDSGGGFLYDRDEVLRDVVREARKSIDQYDVREEARRLLENARSALTVGGATAAGLGAAAVVLIAATAFDVTGGVLAVLGAATLGLVVLPRQRRRATQEFSDRVEALRVDLRRALDAEFGTEADEAIARVRRLVEPIQTLADRQRERLDAAAALQAKLADEIGALHDEVRQRFGEPTLDG